MVPVKNSSGFLWPLSGENSEEEDESQENRLSCNFSLDLQDFIPKDVLQCNISPSMQSILTNIYQRIDPIANPSSLSASTQNTNNMDVILGGKEIFQKIAELVGNAAYEVLIQSHFWEDSPPIQMLKKAISSAAAKKNTAEPLRIYIQVDEPANILEVLDSEINKKNVVIHASSFSNKNCKRNMATTVIIDGHILLISELGFETNSFTDLSHNGIAWSLQGKVTSRAREVFNEIWLQRKNPKREAYLREIPTIFDNTIPNPIPLLCIMSRPQIARRLTDLDTPIITSLHTMLFLAKKTVQIALPNLNISFAVKEIINFINNKNGSVQLLLSQNHESQCGSAAFFGGTNQETVDALFQKIDAAKKEQLKIRWYSIKEEAPTIGNIPGSCHLNMVTVDDTLAMVGSGYPNAMNFRYWHSFNIIVEDPVFTKKVLQVFQKFCL